MARKKKTKKRHQAPSFTLFEILISITLLCSLSLPLYRYYQQYRMLTLNAAAQHLALLATATRQHATAGTTTLSVNSTTGMCSSSIGATYQLPAGIQFGAPPGTLGPPSRPTTPITQPLSGGQRHHDVWTLTWHAHGAGTPATIYLRCGADCRALTIARARMVPVRVWDHW